MNEPRRTWTAPEVRLISMERTWTVNAGSLGDISAPNSSGSVSYAGE